MKPSRYINKIARINILKKKQRTWLSLVSIGLSTAIIFTSLTLFMNIFDFSRSTDFAQSGNFHYATLLTGDAPESSRYSYTYDYDSGQFALYNDQVLNLRQLEMTDNQELLPFVLKEGRFPEASNELVVSSDLGLDVGQTLSLDFQEAQAQTESEQLYPTVDTASLDSQTPTTYQIVGVYTNSAAFESLTGSTQVVYGQVDTTQNAVLYVKDLSIQLSDSFSYFLERMQTDVEHVVSNMDCISSDTVKSYLKNTTTLLLMFILIASIAIAMSLISVHNVVLISDKDRKKEIGLLKSIGATPLEIRKLLIMEMGILGFIGAVLGVFIGMFVSYFVLHLFIERLYITFHIGMITNPLVIIVSFVIGMSLMLISGMKAYRPYIYSTPISDLKNQSYDYEPPEKQSKSRHRSFEWKMFTIYNGRMKKQTKNIFRSFFLLLFTTVLFMAIFFSNIMYRNDYIDSNSDIQVMNYASNGLVAPDASVAEDIYEANTNGQLNASSIYTSRLTSSLGSYYSPRTIFKSELLNSYTATANIGYNEYELEDGTVYNDVYVYPQAFDRIQLEELKPYLVAGSVDQLTSEDVVCVFSGSNRLGYELYQDLEVGMTVLRGSDATTAKPIRVAAIAVIPESAQSSLHFDYANYPRVFAASIEALESEYGLNDVIERISINLVNRSTASSATDIINDIIVANDMKGNYDIENYALTVETNRFSSFIIEALLYPLFFMLFIVSLMNINNVFIGNVHLKSSDVSIMKSVGMTQFQLNMLFILEYLEGYINASLVVIAIFIPICIIEGLTGFASAFKLGDNIFGTLVISIFLLGFLMVAPLVLRAQRRISRIKPIENMKDIN
ncbi:MAG TPA: ABC transporter permease [Candidatus Fimiplasma intestinipullorum]|uniref:ABC transporter permease n=1 Tax=Candidatus Fimiplasma intestinipullorum TaxID=2840825 RepID=A0A9D1HPS2_9FIRM|nr:ABC transporter permease [Candidatus Fimiplasma intestinipullorum]